PQRNPRVQSAAADLRFTGSWYEADVAVDAFGSSELDAQLQASVSGALFRVRRMGHSLRVGAADAVPLSLELDLCVQPDYLLAHGPTEVARLDNDPAAPENGILAFRHVRGGR